MAANDYQHDGSHYKAPMQHGNLVLATGMGYFEGQVSKYIMRWRKKGGIEDLRKAFHYLDKLIENVGAYQEARRLINHDEIARIAIDYCVIDNKLPNDEALLVAGIASWVDYFDLTKVRAKLEHFISEMERTRYWEQPVPLENSNRRADQTKRK